MRQALRACLTVVILSSVTGCVTAFTAMEPPEINVINILPLQSEGILEQRVRIDLRIINPNNFNLHISGASFQLDINDSRFARGVSNQSVTVPRLGEAKTSVVVTTTVMDLFRQVMALDRRQNPNYAIKGKLYLGGAHIRALPFSHSAELVRDMP